MLRSCGKTEKRGNERNICTILICVKIAFYGLAFMWRRSPHVWEQMGNHLENQQLTKVTMPSSSCKPEALAPCDLNLYSSCDGNPLQKYK